MVIVTGQWSDSAGVAGTKLWGRRRQADSKVLGPRAGDSRVSVWPEKEKEALN